MDYKKYLLKVESLKKYFPLKKGVFRQVKGHIKAVDNVSFNVLKGETLGLVGESGCGKSTLGMSLLQLLTPDMGSIFLEGRDTTPWFMNRTSAYSYVKRIYTKPFSLMIKKGLNDEQIIESCHSAFHQNYARIYLKKGETGIREEFFSNLNKKRKYFRKNAQIIFQDPYSSLNPRWRVKSIVAEGLIAHNMVKLRDIKEKTVHILEKVGLSADYLYNYPHQFSGGQRQRIGIARALAVKPKLIVADEAVSALDVSIQSQILNLLKDLQKEFELTFIFISHDLSVIKHISDRIAVMYLGKIVELTSSSHLFETPLHPYTISLISAIPVLDPEVKKRRIVLKGDVPSPLNPPSGCAFHPRCPIAKEKICSEQEPVLREIKKDHWAACHFAGEFKKD